MAMAGELQVIVELRCSELPGTAACGRTAVRLGIQRGAEVVDDVPADVPGVVFEAPLRVVRNEANGRPNFLGPYAHGTVQDRFLYLCWGERIAGGWDGFRRAKVPLKELSWEAVAAHVERGAPLVAELQLTDAKGEPLCASVKPSHHRWSLLDGV